MKNGRKSTVFTRAKDGRGATNIGASFDISAFTSEQKPGFYDNGVIPPPYPDKERCIFVRKTINMMFARRCGNPKLINDFCFYHASKQQQVAYQQVRNESKKR